MNIHERVQRGMALLDEKRPGWESGINLETLNVGDCFDCVLGQIYGRYTTGLKEADVPIDLEEDYGFDVSRYEAPALTKAWKAAIEQRQKETRG